MINFIVEGHIGKVKLYFQGIKRLSSDELVNVNPHPLIEILDYDHPGMYSQIKAIRKAENQSKNRAGCNESLYRRQWTDCKSVGVYDPVESGL